MQLSLLKGTVTISAKLKQPSQDTVSENHLKIALKDTGIGIEPDRLEHIFDNAQSDSSITRKYGGTGARSCYCKAACTNIRW